MRRLLLRIWVLPWPRGLRHILDAAIDLPLVKQLLVPHFRIAVVGLIRDDSGAFLLFRHTYRPDRPWGLPTGFMERGEQPADALRREISEEAGLEVELESLWRAYADADQEILNMVYAGSSRGGTFTPSPEVSDARYFHPEGLPPLLADQRRLIEECVREETRETPV